MQDLQVFNFHSQNVRIETKDGEPLFCLADVASVLDIKNVATLVSNRLDPKGIEKIYTLTDGGKQELIFIDEPNLYRVIFRSNKDAAVQFQDWIFEEVIPQIRKTGKYQVAQPEASEAAYLPVIHDPNQLTVTASKMNLAYLIYHADWVYHWFQRVAEGLKLLNPRLYRQIHHHFSELHLMSFQANREARLINMLPPKAMNSFPWEGSSEERQAFLDQLKHYPKRPLSPEEQKTIDETAWEQAIQTQLNYYELHRDYLMFCKSRTDV